MATATWNGVAIAESDDTVIVERNHYFPREAVNAEYLVDSAMTSGCPWKGVASYYDIIVNGETNKDAAWCYATPKKAAAEIKGRVAFWRGVEVQD